MDKVIEVVASLALALRELPPSEDRIKIGFLLAEGIDSLTLEEKKAVISALILNFFPQSRHLSFFLGQDTSILYPI